MAMQFEIIENHISDKLVLTPVARIDSSVARDFEEHVSNRIAEGNTHFVVDFSRLSFISSAGMRVLLMTAKTLKAGGMGGTLVLCSMRDSIREIFAISGFDKIIMICSTCEEALAYKG